MKRGEGRRAKIRYDSAVYGSIEQVVITPKIKDDDSYLLCNEAKLALEEIGACE